VPRAGRPFGPANPFTNPVVVARVDNHQNGREILGGCADHRRTADVDVLERLFQGHVGATDRLCKWIQVPDDDVDHVDLVSDQLGRVAGVVPPGQNATVHHRMKGLYAPIENFGEARQIGDLLDGQARVLELPGRATGAHQLVTRRSQPAG